MINGDGFTDGQDFIIWNQNKFTSAQRRSAAVPEPCSAALLVLGLLAAAACAGRNKKLFTSAATR